MQVSGGAKACVAAGATVALLLLTCAPAGAGVIPAPVVQLRPAPQTALGLRLMDGEGEGSLRPLSDAPVVRLNPASGPAGWNAGGGNALTCLTQAIYFEARSETLEGQQAVAQVVINRTHIPRFPATVCGVVYQGAERGIGCQFTFVCDGHLREPDDLAAWDRAMGVARQALAGFVFAPMALATHYHAAWMTPYWSADMTRIRQIGGHIFYH